MYPEFETRTSYKYLQKVISALKEPICIIGGWAVFFHVNKNFQKAQGRPYLGSRDIDLGFHIDKNATVEQMRTSSLAKSVEILEKELRFKSISFRLLKEIHTESEEEIEQSRNVPSPFIFPLYVDLLVDSVPSNFKKVFHFQPISLPLLRFVFEQKKYRDELKNFNKKLWLPKVELLLATKITALKERDKGHKRVKDLCDIFALLWYSDEKPQTYKKKIIAFVSREDIRKSIESIKEDDYQNAATQLNHKPEEIERVLKLLI